MSAAARPQVPVLSTTGDVSSKQIALPHVMISPVRPDLVRIVHRGIARNSRQAYAVSEKAGMQHSAHSWGTGRAVARIPRVSGGGTARAGQGAFGNMCRKGRMFAPTKTWRKWHQRVNLKQRRHAVASALAASAVPALVMSRGHQIDSVPQVPLVVETGVESTKKTADAIRVLKALGAMADVDRAKASKTLRAGRGKTRNRRYTQRRGPLIVFNQDHGIRAAFRNLPGVELCQVERLNLLQLAPGAHLGRFVIWTQGAFARLDQIWGTPDKQSAKKGYILPAQPMANSDLARIINSDEVQSQLRDKKQQGRPRVRKRNPLKNFGTMVALNPYAMQVRRSELLAQEARRNQKAEARKADRKAATAASRARKAEKRAIFNRINKEE